MAALEVTTDSQVITILICDDTAGIRGLVTRIAAGTLNMRVIGEAANGEDAIREAARLQPDMILLDLAMPVLAVRVTPEHVPGDRLAVFDTRAEPE